MLPVLRTTFTTIFGVQGMILLALEERSMGKIPPMPSTMRSRGLGTAWAILIVTFWRGFHMFTLAISIHVYVRSGMEKVQIHDT